MILDIKTKSSNVVQASSLDVVLHLFDPLINKPKPSEDDPAFSEDICIIDENGVNGVAFFSFDENRWVFYVDTLIDYNTEGAGIKWKWYYPPISYKDVEW